MSQRVKSLQRALAVLLAFSKEEPELGITELSRKLGLAKPVVHRLVATLADGGFLEKSEVNGKYRVGIRAFEVGSLYLEGDPLEREAVPVLQELANRYSHNAYMGKLHGGMMTYIAVIETPGPIRVHVPVGARAYPHTTAMGKVLLAEMAEAELDAFIHRYGLRQLTSRTVIDPQALKVELAEARRQGVAIAIDENIEGIGAVGAAVRDRTGRAVAGISLAFPTGLVDENRIRELASAIREAAVKISLRLGAQVRREV
jgi:DNA-binding IclR family transcriptional regulator